MTEPTPDEKRNGWTSESLSRYIAERDEALKDHDPRFREPKMPSVANGKYSPFRWRG